MFGQVWEVQVYALCLFSAHKTWLVVYLLTLRISQVILFVTQFWLSYGTLRKNTVSVKLEVANSVTLGKRCSIFLIRLKRLNSWFYSSLSNPYLDTAKSNDVLGR